MTFFLFFKFYNIFGDYMKIYIEVIILVNTLYDFLILSSVSMLLKKYISLKRLLLGCLVGLSSIVFLTLEVSKTILLIYKFITSVAMVLVTFRDKNYIEELFYFYIVTTIIGGMQILINGSYYKVNIVLMSILSPIIIGLYIKSINNHKNIINKIHQVIIIKDENVYNLRGFIDTGNTLVDPITKLPIILTDKIKNNKDEYLYVPCKTINNVSLIKCFKADNIIINNKYVKALIGELPKNILNKYDVLLNENIREIIEC